MHHRRWKILIILIRVREGEDFPLSLSSFSGLSPRARTYQVYQDRAAGGTKATGRGTRAARDHRARRIALSGLSGIPSSRSLQVLEFSLRRLIGRFSLPGWRQSSVMPAVVWWLHLIANQRLYQELPDNTVRCMKALPPDYVQTSFAVNIAGRFRGWA
jgi:hypothetical protein